MGTQHYENFDLEIRREEDTYVALVRSTKDCAEAPFCLPFAAAELARFPLPGGSSRLLSPFPEEADSTGPTEALTPEVFGKRLYAAVFHDDVRDCLTRRLALTEQNQHGLRIRLHLARVPELAMLPWEHLCGPKPPPFALSERTPLVRLIHARPGQETMRVEPPLRILLIISNPGDRLAAETEWQELQDGLADLVRNGSVEIERLSTASLKELRDALRRREYHVLHFIGHGGFDQQTQQGYLLLEEQVDAVALAVQLHDHPPRLVFLNACHSGSGSASNLLAGTAQRLLEYGIPAVIAMQTSISDRAAVVLAREFYRAVAQGYPVDAALANARQALFASRQKYEWCIPVLFSDADDNVLLEAPEAEAPEANKPPAELPRLPFEPAMASIAAGPFQMGSAHADDIAQGDWPLQQVELPAYRISIYPITNRQYAAFVKAEQERRPHGFGWSFIKPPPHKEDYPVVGVSYDDACAYCRWLSQQTGRSYRLPDEAEWEKAARGAEDERRYPWGDELTDGCCNFASRETQAVDAYPQGQSPYGCHSMIGNIYEWTCTVWGEQNRRTGDPACRGAKELADEDHDPGRMQVCKGGPIQNGKARLGCSVRHRFALHAHHSNLGFRVVEERSHSASEGEGGR